MQNHINRALLKLSKRAESTARETLIQTFVDVGPLFALLSSNDHQVLFGRRGTGKTHALAFLEADRTVAGDAVCYVDLRTIGSSAGIYADETIPVAERSTKLLVDTLAAVHGGITNYCIEKAESLNLSETGPILDALADAITTVRVVGKIEKQEENSTEVTDKWDASVKLQMQKDPRFGASFAASAEQNAKQTASTKRTGTENLYVNFGATGQALRNLTAKLDSKRIWILLDEWSSVPLTLQPYLADLIRRSFLPIHGITVKIAAIEHRSTFQIKRSTGDYVGIELGADAAADINLDDFMVFDNDPERAKKFFQDLIARHVISVVKDTEDQDLVPQTTIEIVQETFTEKRAMEEFVRACEGVPRDAINIIALAAQKSLDSRISVHSVRTAAKNWYQRDKEKAVSADERAHTILHKIIDDVIGDRKARAFLLLASTKSTLIDTLYDSRVLHILKKGISTHDQPGVRFDAYKLDYGCYVDLLTTQKAPQGLFPSDEIGVEYIDVPPDDYRSIRRAILDPKTLD